MVTAEMATALPVLVLLAFVAVLAVGVAQARVRCADAAREAARAIARADPAAADAIASTAAGRPISMTTSTTSDGDTAVSIQVRLRPIGWLSPITLTERAVVATEPVAGPAP